MTHTADLEWRFPADPASTRSARHRVVEALGDLHLDRASDSAALVVSELTSNALLHARSEFVVRLVVRPPQEGRPVLRIEVGDGSSDLPTVHNFTIASTSGRGLHLVESLSAAWGVEVVEGRVGKTVWAELDLDADLLPTSFNFDDVDPL